MHDNVIEIQNILQHTFAICLQRRKEKNSLKTCFIAPTKMILNINNLYQNQQIDDDDNDDDMTDCN